jgi:hypothetical protein
MTNPKKPRTEKGIKKRGCRAGSSLCNPAEKDVGVDRAKLSLPSEIPVPLEAVKKEYHFSEEEMIELVAMMNPAYSIPSARSMLRENVRRHQLKKIRKLRKMEIGKK